MTKTKTKAKGDGPRKWRPEGPRDLGPFPVEAADVARIRAGETVEIKIDGACPLDQAVLTIGHGGVSVVVVSAEDDVATVAAMSR